mgnify:CR=1 FL=1
MSRGPMSLAPGALTQGKVPKSILCIGGGYIGLEAAAVASGLGLDVTVVELAPRILQRVAAPATSGYFRALHQQNGVTILENTGLNSFEEKDGRVSAATLSDGRELAVDFVITGIGVAPNIQLASDADLDIDNGIAVNLQSQTSVTPKFAQSQPLRIL